jgi:hypothetical protein
MPMPRQSEFSADWATEPPIEPPARRTRASRGFARFLITFCIGVAATLAWQSYGDAARESIAGSYPQLSWLAPQPAAAQTIPAAIVPPTDSSDPQELKTISFNLAAIRKRVDQLSASQDQITRDIATKLQTVKQEILDKISVPSPQAIATPARKPVPPPLQVAPSR